MSNAGTLMVNFFFFWGGGVYYTIIIIRNLQDSIGNDLGPYIA